MNLELFLARKIYAEGGDRRRVSQPAIQIATAGVAIGLAVMIVSVSVILGFKHTIRDKVVGFGSHIQVANFLTLQTSEQHPIAINDSMKNTILGIEGVAHAERFVLKQGILKTDNDFLGIVFKGIAEEYDTTFLHKHMVEGSIPHFSAVKSSNNILISNTIARQLLLKTGDKIFAYFIDQGGVRARRFTIAGIYETNLAQYDRSLCLTDLYTARKLNGWETDQVSGAEVLVKDFEQLDQVAARFVETVNRKQDRNGETFSSRTIRELNPQIFSWLNLLDLNVWIILALMTAVAGVTMISGLLIIILERTQMIGILKALGARNQSIRRTFLWFAVFIIGRGLLIGNIIGIGLVILQDQLGLVKLNPATYYVSTVPAELNLPIVLALNLATLLISVFMLIAPSYLVAHIHPAKSMRYE